MRRKSKLKNSAVKEALVTSFQVAGFLVGLFIFGLGFMFMLGGVWDEVHQTTQAHLKNNLVVAGQAGYILNCHQTSSNCEARLEKLKPQIDGEAEKFLKETPKYKVVQDLPTYMVRYMKAGYTTSCLNNSSAVACEDQAEKLDQEFYQMVSKALAKNS